jgi:hypothetical protein
MALLAVELVCGPEASVCRQVDIQKEKNQSACAWPACNGAIDIVADLI